MEKQGRCTEERNPAQLKQKQQNPDRLFRRGLVLNKICQSWRIEIWLPERNGQHGGFDVFSFSRC